MVDSSKLEKYDEEFFNQQLNNTSKIKAAQLISKIVLNNCGDINSIVDVGCGIGIWLNEFMKQGINNITGVDGNYVNTDLMLLAKENFISHDLEDRFNFQQKYDLACSLEVAEHLALDKAEQFIEELTQLAPIILFSAAIPNQGGKNHINEQWQHYWARLFAKFDYLAVDLIRPKVWSNTSLQICYRQNILMYVKKSEIDKHPKLKEAYEHTNQEMLSMVHPQTLERLKKIWLS